MRQLFGKRFVPVVAIVGLWAMSLSAQPPAPGKGPPPNAEFVTVRGTIKEFTTAPKGEVDGVILTDGTWVHWPPHLADRFSDLVGKGDKIRAAGYMETGPKGDTKLEVSALTNLKTNRTGENPDRPAPADVRNGANSGVRAGDARTVTGTVKELTTAPKGEADGLILSDGTWVHWPPHLETRFTGFNKGDRVRATGYMETGPRGDTKLEVSTLTNLRTNKTSENLDRPLTGSARPAAGKERDVNERLQSLEDQLEQLRREVQRLGR